MCELATTSKFDVQQVPMRGQLEHGCQGGKRIGHLILFSWNVVERDIIEGLGQLLDVSLIGYQLMIPSLPFSPQLVYHQGRVSVHFEQLDVEVNYCLDPEDACLVLSHIIHVIETQSGREGNALIVGRDQSCPNPMA